MAITKKKASLKDRLKKKREELKSRGGKGDMIFMKEGTLRVRILPVHEETDFVQEVVQFYLGPEIKGVISPSTFDMPCAIMEKYDKLRNSKDNDDKEIAKKFVPKKRYLACVLVYKDLKGKEIDTELSGKLILLPGGIYQEIIDHYLDEDDWGDMMDPVNGYDFKVKRSGTTQTDTEYTFSPCPKTPLPKAWNKIVNLEEKVKSILPTYEETVEHINEFLKLDDDEKLSKKASLKERIGLKKKIKKDI